MILTSGKLLSQNFICAVCFLCVLLHGTTFWKSATPKVIKFGLSNIFTWHCVSLRHFSIIFSFNGLNSLRKQFSAPKCLFMWATMFQQNWKLPFLLDLLLSLTRCLWCWLCKTEKGWGQRAASRVFLGVRAWFYRKFGSFSWWNNKTSLHTSVKKRKKN